MGWLMLCVLILYMSVRWDLQFKVTPSDRLFFMTILFYSQPEICWEDVAEEIFFQFFFFVLMSDLGFDPRP